MEKLDNNNNKFKLKISRIFSSSCITQDISKVIDHNKALFTPKTPLIDLEELKQQDDDNLSSYPVIRPQKQPPLLLACKPRCPESFDQMVRESCILPRRRVAGRYCLLTPEGKCPHFSPATPLFQKKKKKNKKGSKRRGFGNNLEKTHFKNHNHFSFSSSNNTDWFSSDDEREEEDDEHKKTETTLFPSFNKSISLSSDSKTRVRNRRRQSNSGSGSGSGSSRVYSKGQEMETFAVVKSSSDPYSDFRTSMAEMIIEKQIFGEKELEKLLKCFLSLNSSYHHHVIIEVFTEIWDALFSYRSW